MGDEPVFKGMGGYDRLSKWLMRKKVDPTKGDLKSRLVQKGRVEGFMKLIFEKLCESSLFPFKTRAPLFCY